MLHQVLACGKILIASWQHPSVLLQPGFLIIVAVSRESLTCKQLRLASWQHPSTPGRHVQHPGSILVIARAKSVKSGMDPFV